MKNYKFNNFSIVLATFLFAVGGLSFANAVKIDGAKLTGNNWIGNSNPNESNVTVTNNGAGSDYNNDQNIYGARISNGADAANNTVKVTGTEITTDSIEAARVGGSSASGIKKVRNNSIVIKDSNVTASIWAGRANDNNQADVNYNTTQIENSTITHNQLRGGISWPDKGTADYNTLYIKDSTTIGKTSSVGNTYEITGGFTQDYYNPDASNTGIASYNQLIYDNVTTYTNDKSATIKYLFGGAGRSGEANNNRAFVRDLNKNIADSVTIQTYVVGGATWRPRSGGAEGNIAVAVGDSKIAGIYGGAVAFSNSGAATESTKGANKNLVILDLSKDGVVTENVYGGYIFDTSMGSTTGNAVYALSGTVKGSIVGGNKDNNNTLILGKDTSSIGTINAGAITGFESLQFNTLEKKRQSCVKFNRE